jgi:AraC-like DNA-binding protein
MNTVPYSDLISYYVERPDRRAVDLREAGVPECVVLGQALYRRAYPPLQEHRHYGVAELAYLESGFQPYNVLDREFTLFGGEGTIIPPDTGHGSSGQPSYPCKKAWIQLRLPDENSTSDWLGLSPEEAQPILEMLRHPVNLYSKWPADFPQLISRLFAIADRPPSPTRTAMLRTCLQHILFELLERNVPETAPAHQLRVRRVITWLGTHISESPTVEHLAREAGLSSSSFKRIFHSVTGMTPHAYILHKKIERAMDLLLEADMRITDVAQACGFSTSQYFATVFKRMTGVSPNDVLRKRGIALPVDTDGQ